MQFAHLIWLIAGLASCMILGFGFYHFQKKGETALRRFAAGHLLEKLTRSVSPGRRRVKRILLILAVASIFTALAQPQIGFKWKEVKRKGIDILMAVDTSKSMLANDIKPNRLERSKLGILDFVSRLEGDRLGLIPFSGTAFLMCPLTLDYDAFRQSLDALDTEIIPNGGTDIASAIREAESTFANDANHKILVLVTDGEDLEGEALVAAKEAAVKGMTIYTVGVGTSTGELIPLNRTGKGASFVKDGRGRMVKSRLDEKMLRQIAEVTGGQYEPLGQQAEGLDVIYKQKLILVPKQELAERVKKIPIDYFEWPLIMAIIFLIIEFAVSDRKPHRKDVPVIKTADRRLMKGRKKLQTASVAVLILAFLSGSNDAWASPRSAEKAYNKKDYAMATEEYRATIKEDPENAQLQFNFGAAAYKDKKYDEARSAFQTALNDKEISLQNQAYYNIGNTLYRQGQGTEKSKPKETIKSWEESIKAYEGALKLDQEDKDARFNQEFVKKKLEELKKKQKQKKKKKKNKSKCNNKDKNKDKNNKSKDNKKDKNNKNKDNNKSKNNNKSKDNKKENNKNKDKNKDKNKGNNKERNKDKKQNKNQGNNKGNDQKKNKGQNKSQSAQKNDQLKKKNQQQKNNQKSAKSGPEKKQTGKAENKSIKGQKSPSRKNVKPRKPGQMTEEQARNLLDSLKGDERSMPMVAKNKGKGKARHEKKRRDW